MRESVTVDTMDTRQVPMLLYDQQSSCAVHLATQCAVHLLKRFRVEFVHHVSLQHVPGRRKSCVVNTVQQRTAEAVCNRLCGQQCVAASPRCCLGHILWKSLQASATARLRSQGRLVRACGQLPRSIYGQQMGAQIGTDNTAADEAQVTLEEMYRHMQQHAPLHCDHVILDCALCPLGGGLLSQGRCVVLLQRVSICFAAK